MYFISCVIPQLKALQRLLISPRVKAQSLACKGLSIGFNSWLTLCLPLPQSPRSHCTSLSLPLVKQESDYTFNTGFCFWWWSSHMLHDHGHRFFFSLTQLLMARDDVSLSQLTPCTCQHLNKAYLSVISTNTLYIVTLSTNSMAGVSVWSMLNSCSTAHPLRRNTITSHHWDY